jgi:hypothetical protein
MVAGASLAMLAGCIAGVLDDGYDDPAGAPRILEHPTDCYAVVGGYAQFAVVATGDNLQYQWHAYIRHESGAIESAPIAGATGPVFEYLVEADPAFDAVWCVISNELDTVKSGMAFLYTDS